MQSDTSGWIRIYLWCRGKCIFKIFFLSQILRAGAYWSKACRMPLCFSRSPENYSDPVSKYKIISSVSHRASNYWKYLSPKCYNLGKNVIFFKKKKTKYLILSMVGKTFWRPLKDQVFFNILTVSCHWNEFYFFYLHYLWRGC